MTTIEQIKKVAQQIGEEFHPQRVILFGSYAKGQPTKDSDVDFLIITPVEKRPVDKSVEIHLKIRPPFLYHHGHFPDNPGFARCIKRKWNARSSGLRLMVAHMEIHDIRFLEKTIPSPYSMRLQ
ncbi:MAG: nucleotidyltransferase domain-containing protein [Syntrophaceae bacterium]|nr:nucleotidyltransferase domain-containing protein [Syntrophaceae bacterium]